MTQVQTPIIQEAIRQYEGMVNAAALVDINSDKPLVQPKAKPLYLMQEACSGCKGYDLSTMSAGARSATCSMEGSPFKGNQMSGMAMVACGTYSPRTEVPEGFNLI